jgi:hypothetical protein
MSTINSKERRIEIVRKKRDSMVESENKAFLATRLYISAFFIAFLLLMYILISNAEIIKAFLS